METAAPLPFTNVQLELLKTFSHLLPENELLELRKTLALFFAQRLVTLADEVWVSKNWTNETIDNMLHTKMRKLK